MHHFEYILVLLISFIINVELKYEEKENCFKKIGNIYIFIKLHLLKQTSMETKAII